MLCLLQEMYNIQLCFSSQTIFYTFPRLSELADDEWIPPWKFEKMAVFSDSSLPVRNPVADLSQMQPGDWIQQDKGTAREQNPDQTSGTLAPTPRSGETTE